MNQQKKFNTFRLTFPELVYESYTYNVQPDGLHISFKFRLNSQICFAPQSLIPTRSFLNFNLPKADLDWLVFNIGMAELVSYWKAYCPPTITILPFRLDKEQQDFWRKLYFNGLGEFFYVNGIRTAINTFVAFKADSGNLPPATHSYFHNYSDTDTLVPIGGGKDSVCTLEMLTIYARQKSASAPRPLIMNPRGATTECCRVAGYTLDDVLVINRAIDPLLLEHNKKGALNGHTPFSAVLAFYSLLAAAVSDKPSIALSNEASANESTVLDTNINHQYSKSFEFEQDFRNYTSAYISPQFNYYSFLRPLTEIQIARYFASLTQYHDVFRSCNAGSKQDIWCCHCPKCLFAYIILSPFIAPERLAEIFGRPLLDCEDMIPYLQQLTGEAETKPFECVGTVDEVTEALSLSATRWYKDKTKPLLYHNYTPRADVASSLECCTNPYNHNLTEPLFKHLKEHAL